MNTNKLVLLILFGFIFNSCKHTDRIVNIDQEFQIDYDNNETFKWFSQAIVETVIPLELTDNSILGLAKKCIVRNNLIIFVDYKQKEVFVFDIQGNFKYSINNIGQGMEEYISINDVQFNWNNTEIMILDDRAIIGYDCNNGKFRERINITDLINKSQSIPFFNFINPNKDIFYLWTDMGEYTLYKSEINNCYGINKRKSYELINERFSYTYNGDYLLYPDYGKFDIQDIKTGNIKYKINLGNKALPENLLPQNSKEFDKINKEYYFKCITNIKESKDGLYLQIVNPYNKYYEIYINKKTGDIIKGAYNTEDGLNIVDVENEFFYALIYPQYLSNSSKFNKILKPYLSDDANPILLKMKFK